MHTKKGINNNYYVIKIHPGIIKKVKMEIIFKIKDKNYILFGFNVKPCFFFYFNKFELEICLLLLSAQWFLTLKFF